MINWAEYFKVIEMVNNNLFNTDINLINEFYYLMDFLNEIIILIVAPKPYIFFSLKFFFLLSILIIIIIIIFHLVAFSPVYC